MDTLNVLILELISTSGAIATSLVFVATVYGLSNKNGPHKLQLIDSVIGFTALTITATIVYVLIR